MTGLMHQQLPVVMAGDRHLSAFLAGLDELATGLYDRIGQKELRFDPSTAPPELVHLPAEWVDVPIDAALPDQLRRRVALVAAETFPCRGTRRSLSRNLAALTGDGAPVSVDPVDGQAEVTRPVVTIVDPWGITTDAGPDPDDETGPSRRPRPTRTAADEPSDTADESEHGAGSVEVALSGFGMATEEMVRDAIRRELRCGVTYTITLEPAAAEQDEEQHEEEDR